MHLNLHPSPWHRLLARPRRGIALVVIAFLVCCLSARGVILLSTGDPAANTTEPTGALAGSGWNYEGVFGAFLGTAISPHHFVTVQHIGIASNTFLYRGVNYTIVNWFDDQFTELRIFEVAETMPDYAPLYDNTNELGQDVVVIGRGTQRGGAVNLGSTLRGWLWGPGDGVQRWGQNQIDQAPQYSIWMSFDQNGGPNECQLSSGDSGGAVFMMDNGIWKLAGIAFAADGAIWTGPSGPEIDAALFDTRGFYDTTGRLISGSAPIPSRSMSVRISGRLAWIQSILSPGSPTPTPSPTPTATPVPTATPTPTAPVSAGPEILDPTPGSTLPSSSVMFDWSGGGASKFQLAVGTSPGGRNIYNSKKLKAHSALVKNIPAIGGPIYVRLSWQVKKQWRFSDYVFQAN